MMQFGVLVHRADTGYDDRLPEQYQFPRQYLTRAKALQGNWVVFYSPVKTGAAAGYFAVARMAEITRDVRAPEMFVIFVEPGTYLEFPARVPLRTGGQYVEAGLLGPEGRITRRAQQAVRSLSAVDFNLILDKALGAESPLPRVDDSSRPGFGEPDPQPLLEAPMERERILTSRTLRKRVFRSLVVRAYCERCAVAGTRFINGGGRAEVEAAHIRPVEADGPDALCNGLALSGTAHWMFDRGLIGVSDEYVVLISRQVNDPEGVRSFVNPTGRLIVPAAIAARPDRRYLRWHRENRFKT